VEIDQAIKFFGCVSDHAAFDAYLITLDIPNRPVFIENPMEWVSKKQEGFIFMFAARPGFEKTYGKSKGEGDMVFEGIRLHAKQNTDGLLEYGFPLPFGLDFSQKIDVVKNILGSPALDDEAPKEENRLCVWRKLLIGEAYVQLSIVFLPKNEGIAFLTLKPVALRFQ
jgi:hypothetical protein